MGKSLTKPQTRALVALVLLSQESRRAGYMRREIRLRSDWSLASFPTRTMRALQRLGYVRPLCDTALQLVESGACRCGCDMWQATDEGKAYVSTLRVKESSRGG